MWKNSEMSIVGHPKSLPGLQIENSKNMAVLEFALELISKIQFNCFFQPDIQSANGIGKLAKKPTHRFKPGIYMKH